MWVNFINLDYFLQVYGQEFQFIQYTCYSSYIPWHHPDPGQFQHNQWCVQALASAYLYHRLRFLYPVLQEQEEGSFHAWSWHISHLEQPVLLLPELHFMV